jgi:hypothetical protein
MCSISPPLLIAIFSVELTGSLAALPTRST